jgi:hypothetical protein
LLTLLKKCKKGFISYGVNGRVSAFSSDFNVKGGGANRAVKKVFTAYASQLHYPPAA